MALDWTTSGWLIIYLSCEGVNKLVIAITYEREQAK